MLQLNFTTDNVAFDGSARGDECARILRGIAGLVETGETAGRIFDANGNMVGSWSVA